MAYYNTILSQITANIPRHVFDYHAKIHHSGQKFRSHDHWSQFTALLIGQLSGRKSSSSPNRVGSSHFLIATG